jgi:hypothetical protein
MGKVICHYLINLLVIIVKYKNGYKEWGKGKDDFLFILHKLYKLLYKYNL